VVPLLLAVVAATAWPAGAPAATARGATDLWVRSANARLDQGRLDLRLVASNHGTRGSRFAMSSVSWRPVRSVRPVVLRRFRLPPVGARGRRAVRLRVVLPPGARGGYLVTVCLNVRRDVREKRTANNCRSAGLVTVADLPAAVPRAPEPPAPSAGIPGLPAPAPSSPPDATPPETTIDVAPPAMAGQSTATFWFSASRRATFECRLDAGPWAYCTSPRQYASLAAGPHLFEVRAVDAGGLVEPEPAAHAWTVDLTRPQTTITAGPAGTVASPAATLEFTSDDPSATFECRVDVAPWAPCASPAQVSGLTDGAHTFAVRAVDPAGNQDTTPDLRAWTVDTTAPGTEITGGPSGDVPAGDVAFSFTSEDPGASFECRVDEQPFSACVSPHPVPAPAPGAHTFEVRAVDAVGNADPSPAAGAWTTLAPPEPG
jgi:hypothetical protein